MKNPLWKQANAADQRIALMWGLEGIVYAYDKGIYDKEQFLEKSLFLMRQLLELEPFLKDESLWNPKTPD